jgi:predicted LPLAT superfamily acyltransferase
MNSPPLAPGAAARSARRAVATSWIDIAERGSVAGIWTMVIICRTFGRSFGRLVLRAVVLYFVVAGRRARRASQAYLTRMGRPHGFWDAYRHCLTFAHCTLDRLFWVTGRQDLFQITTTGSEHLMALVRSRRGALLFGAHLGSFEAMLGVARHQSVPINIVGYFKNARLINGVLDKLNPRRTTRLINVEPGMNFVMTLKERIDQGELVAILADRVGLAERSTEVDFLGGRALFPSGPTLLAAILRCPVYLTFGLYSDPNRYHLYCEPFAERIELPRGDRDRAAALHVQRFATRLEHYCGLAADNWFNFYDYWAVTP